MTKRAHEIHYSTYWITWALLLVLTFVMIWIGTSPLPLLWVVILLIVAMMAKASLIGAYFMHLRFEKFSLVLTVVAGLVVTALLLFVVISFDSARIFELAIR